jgi:hypothetical protein
MSPFLCKLGAHKWRNFGDRVVLVWREPGLLIGTKVTKTKRVYCNRECLRCGIRETRKFIENIDGTMAADGWKQTGEDMNNESLNNSQ